MNTLTMAKRIIKQIRGDKRSLALLFVAPIFILWLLGIILNSPSYSPKIEVINCSDEYIEFLKEDSEITVSTDYESSIKNLKNNLIDAIIEDNGNKVTVEGTDTSVTMSVKKVLSSATMSLVSEKLSGIKALLANLPNANVDNFPEIGEDEFVYLNGSSEQTAFDLLAPVLMGFFIFFFVFLLAGVSFLRERISGTLERLVATPIKRIEIVMGYFLGFGVFVILQTIIIQTFGIFVLNIEVKGSFLLLLFINLLLASCSLSLGTLLSAFAKNEFQLFQFIPIVLVPQILLSGIFSLKGTPDIIEFLSKLFPLTYAADALKGVVVKGSSFMDIALDIGVLFGFCVVFVFLNTVALKKYRKI